MIRLTDILHVITENKIDELIKTNFMEGGHNGPYYDPETPVRNTAHWATTFSYFYRKTHEQKYLNALKICADYLLSKNARPMNASFFCRHKTDKDFSNGIIGTAWAIEGLISGYKIIKDEKYLNVAEEVFLLFPYDEKYNLWKTINVDGSIKGFDMTFNHQLWFAAAGVMLLSVRKNVEVRKRCELFFQNIPKLIRTYRSGLIKHSIYLQNGILTFIKNYLKNTKLLLKKIKTSKSMKYKENGYHLFNIYAFALIKEYGYTLRFFNTKLFKKSLNYCFSKELYHWLEKKSVTSDINIMPEVKNNNINIYGYSYNAPGFELPYIHTVFMNTSNNNIKFVNDIIDRQIALTYGNDMMSFCLNNDDPKVLDSRIYEYTRSLKV